MQKSTYWSNRELLDDKSTAYKELKEYLKSLNVKVTPEQVRRATELPTYNIGMRRFLE